MADGPRQLALDLPIEPSFDPEDFLVSPSNEAAYAAVESWPVWPDGILLLVGPPGSGKSHLAAVWRARSHAWTLRGAELAGADIPHLVSSGALVIEDCDLSPPPEDALFHLVNAARERGCSILMTARARPDDWGLVTRDLLSRLRLATTAELEPPDDALLRAILVKLFLERQLVVDTTVVDFIAHRTERSVAAARDLVEMLDREALARRRRINRGLVAELLRSPDPGEGEGGAA